MPDEITTPDPTAEAARAAADAAAAKAASDAAAAAEAARVAAEAEQKVPLSRLQVALSQTAEQKRANEALQRELKLAEDTIAEFRALGTRGQNNGTQTNGNGTERQEQRTSGATKPLTATEFQQAVRAEAETLNFNKRCDESAALGRAAHEDFEKVVLGDLTSVSPVLNAQTGRPALPISLIEAALETGQGHEVLYALGKDIAEASRIMSLRPVVQAVELAKFASKLSAATKEETNEGENTQVSKAPVPIKAPTKSGAVRPAFKVEDTENFSTAEWIKNREKQIAADRANR